MISHFTAVDVAISYFTKTFYHQAIIPLVVITVFLAWQARPSTSEQIPVGFRKFVFNYMVVWIFCVGADWLQGPYVYALYAAYGFSRQDIAALFVVGFGASLIFSCFVGAFVDRFGRKKSALAYCLLYIASCMTKHFKHYWVLILGRVTGGIATSLLFSSFECWMVSEHLGRNKFSNGLLSYVFGMMYMVMYLVAIGTGFVGEHLSDSYKFMPIAEGSIVHTGGNLCPFDLAILFLIAGFALICTLWSENYGSDEALTESSSQSWNFAEATKLLWTDRRAWLLGVVVSSFEGAMYAFVFNWTPALESKIVPPPYGLIFSLFMMACMCGASIATILGDSLKPSTRLLIAFSVGASGLCTAAATMGSGSGSLVSCFIGFLLFEFSVGLYFPSVGIVKSEVVPERIRATVYNIYRVPLNGIVVGLLMTNMVLVQAYTLCALLLAVAGVATAVIAQSAAPRLLQDLKDVSYKAV